MLMVEEPSRLLLLPEATAVEVEAPGPEPADKVWNAPVASFGFLLGSGSESQGICRLVLLLLSLVIKGLFCEVD